MVASRTVERGLGWFLLVVGGLDVLIAVFLLVVCVSDGEWGYAFGALAWVGISVGAVVAGRTISEHLPRLLSAVTFRFS